MHLSHTWCGVVILDVPMTVGSKPGTQELAKVSKADDGNGETVR